MSAMILNDMEKAWLTPLLELRNELGDFEKDRERRDFRRMHSPLLLHNDRLVPGPYTKEWREYWLPATEAEKQIQETAPPEFKDIKLITQEELDEIRRIWVERTRIDDSLPESIKRLPVRSLRGATSCLGAVWETNGICFASYVAVTSCF